MVCPLTVIPKFITQVMQALQSFLEYSATDKLTMFANNTFLRPGLDAIAPEKDGEESLRRCHTGDKLG